MKMKRNEINKRRKKELRKVKRWLVDWETEHFAGERLLSLTQPILSHSAPQVNPFQSYTQPPKRLGTYHRIPSRPSQGKSAFLKYVLNDILYTDSLISLFSKNTLNYIATFDLSHVSL